MLSRHCWFMCTSLLCIIFAVVLTQNVSANGAPRTRFACRGRPPGYYADVETGCQVYHMCDALGRQFTYTCPNTTLFQQRMLVCDHWYMVNCSKSEGDYGANLLIGQRDKPFVSEEEMRLRTPRPDILSVPPNNNYYDGLKEAESKYPVIPGNSIVGVADGSSSFNNGLESAQTQYRPPTSWSTGSNRPVHQQTQNSQNQGFGNQGQGSLSNQKPSGSQNGQYYNQGQLSGQNYQRPSGNQNGQSSLNSGNQNGQSQTFDISSQDQLGGQNYQRPSGNQNGQSSQDPGNQNGQSQSFDSFGQYGNFNNQGQTNPSVANQNIRNPQTSQSSNSLNQGFGNQNSQKPIQNTHNPSSSSQHQGIGPHVSLTAAASQKTNPTIQTTPDFTQNTGEPQLNLDLTPPLPPKPTATEAPSSEEYDMDIRMKNNRADPVVNFINRFDPNSPTAHKTSMTASEIQDINQQLPQGQDVSAEEVKIPRKNKDRVRNINALENEKKGMTVQSRFNTVNVKLTTPTPEAATNTDANEPQNPGIRQPDVFLVPPKTEYSDLPSTTMGPPIYYEWKWAVPAFDLETPKLSNITYSNTAPTGRNAQGKRPFSDVTRPTPTEDNITPSSFNTEYNISSYFVPDYIFPLDEPHPGYEHEEAQTSFQVNAARPGRSSYGENPACPQCHPGYVKPGTCEPCILER